MAKDHKPEDEIDYTALLEEAARGVIRLALKRGAGPRGLPGDHHFYISFRTGAPGVSIPPELRARFPEDMTIVLQNQFWDLTPGEAAFSVTLQFNGQPKSLSIPYAAVTRFHDPSASYLLEFPWPPVVTPRVEQITKPPPAAETSKVNVVSLEQFRKR